MHEATSRKRQVLGEFIRRHVAPHDAIRAVVVYGSVATGHARDDSDVDAYVFMDPLDLTLVPAEAIWNPQDDSFRSIFSDRTLSEDELQVDFTRVSLRDWSDSDFSWPGAAKAVLRRRWVAHEQPGTHIDDTIAERIVMTPEQRQALLDQALLDADGLIPDDPSAQWDRLDHAESFDRLNALWEALVAGLFAVNGEWLPYRGRAVRELASLPWTFATGVDQLTTLCSTKGQDRAAYLARLGALQSAHEALLARLGAEPHYGEDPVFAAFLRAHDEPGRAWNLQEWLRSRP